MNAIKAPFMVSALDHRDSISGDDITLEPHPQMTKLMLRGEEQLLAAWIKKTLQITAPKPCKSTYKKDEALHWLGPDTWLYIASDGEISKTALSSFAQAGVRGQVTDVSHHYTHFEVSGPRARDALQKLSTLDLHRSVFASGDVAGTLFARASVILAAREDDCFDLIVRRSYADYLWCLVANAGYEYGLPEQTPLAGEILRT